MPRKPARRESDFADAGVVQQAGLLHRRSLRRRRAPERVGPAGLRGRARCRHRHALSPRECGRRAVCVAGYFVTNDVTARDWQRRSPTWTLGKSFDTHGPTGPWLATTDEIPDPHALSLRLTVNGERRQNTLTDRMIHTVFEQIEHLSTVMTLEARGPAGHRHRARRRHGHEATRVPEGRRRRPGRNRRSWPYREPHCCRSLAFGSGRIGTTRPTQ